MARTLFFGDMEAQHKIWQTDLEPILEGLNSVVQLGNLISCTVEAADKKEYGRNEAILTLWDKSEAKNKVKLIGQNEMVSLSFPEEWTNSRSSMMIRDAWLSKEPTWFTAIEDKKRLVTPAGLTYGEWVSIGRPEDAFEAASRLHEKYIHTLHQGDCFRLTGRPNMAANPIWADPVLELYPSWILAEEECPFDQIHGGETLNVERGRSAVADPSNILHYLDTVSYKPFGSISTVKEAVFRGIGLDLLGESMTSLPKDKSFYVESF